jgi:hypothetical protein
MVHNIQRNYTGTYNFCLEHFRKDLFRIAALNTTKPPHQLYNYPILQKFISPAQGGRGPSDVYFKKDWNYIYTSAYVFIASKLTILTSSNIYKCISRSALKVNRDITPFYIPGVTVKLTSWSVGYRKSLIQRSEDTGLCKSESNQKYTNQDHKLLF